MGCAHPAWKRASIENAFADAFALVSDTTAPVPLSKPLDGRRCGGVGVSFASQPKTRAVCSSSPACSARPIRRSVGDTLSERLVPSRGHPRSHAARRWRGPDSEGQPLCPPQLQAGCTGSTSTTLSSMADQMIMTLHPTGLGPTPATRQARRDFGPSKRTPRAQENVPADCPNPLPTRRCYVAARHVAGHYRYV